MKLGVTVRFSKWFKNFSFRFKWWPAWPTFLHLKPKLWKSGRLVSGWEESWSQGAFFVGLGMWREGPGPLRKAGFPNFSACFLFQNHLSCLCWFRGHCLWLPNLTLSSDLQLGFTFSVSETCTVGEQYWPLDYVSTQQDYHSVLSTNRWDTSQAHLGNFTPFPPSGVSEPPGPRVWTHQQSCTLWLIKHSLQH